MSDRRREKSHLGIKERFAATMPFLYLAFLMLNRGGFVRTFSTGFCIQFLQGLFASSAGFGAKLFLLIAATFSELVYFSLRDHPGSKKAGKWAFLHLPQKHKFLGGRIHTRMCIIFELDRRSNRTSPSCFFSPPSPWDEWLLVTLESWETPFLLGNPKLLPIMKEEGREAPLSFLFLKKRTGRCIVGETLFGAIFFWGGCWLKNPLTLCCTGRPRWEISCGFKSETWIHLAFLKYWFEAIHLIYTFGTSMLWNLPSFSFLKKVSGIQTFLASVIVRYLILPGNFLKNV